jgi:hypothetical protein
MGRAIRIIRERREQERRAARATKRQEALREQALERRLEEERERERAEERLREVRAAARLEAEQEQRRGARVKALQYARRAARRHTAHEEAKRAMRVEAWLKERQEQARSVTHEEHRRQDRQQALRRAAVEKSRRSERTEERRAGRQQAARAEDRELLRQADARSQRRAQSRRALKQLRIGPSADDRDSRSELSARRDARGDDLGAQASARAGARGKAGRRDTRRSRENTEHRMEARVRERAETAAEGRRSGRGRDTPPRRVSSASFSDLSGALDWLRVRGSALIGPRGSRFSPRGLELLPVMASPVSETGAWLQLQRFADIRAWGATCVVVPVVQTLALFGGDSLSNWSYLEALDETIAAAASEGLYSIIQLTAFVAHPGLPDLARPSLPTEDSIQLWSLLAQRYASEPAVLFDLFRDPKTPAAGTSLAGLMPVLTPSIWRDWSLAMLGAIRRHHPRAVVIVKGADRSAAALPIHYTDGTVPFGLVYAIATDHVGANLAALERLAAANPVMVAPWYVGQGDAGVVEALAPRLARQGIGWIIGALHRDGAALLSREGDATRPTVLGNAVRRSFAFPHPPDSQLAARL